LTEPDCPDTRAVTGHRIQRFPRQFVAGWSGLTATDAKRGIAAADLATVDVDGTEMVLAPELLDAPRDPVDDVLALPGFDEYLLGFKDRSLMVDAEHKQAIIPGANGVFQSTVVRGGRVVATWKRPSTRTRTTVAVFPLVTLRATERKRIEAAFEPYARFVGRPVEVRWPEKL